MFPILLLITAFSTQSTVSLSHVHHKGEKLNYEVKSHISVEHRQMGLRTFIPEDLDIQYKFSTEVLELKPEGIVDLRYERPTMTEIRGETYESPPKTTIDQINLKYLLTVSPINEILKSKSLDKATDGKKIKHRALIQDQVPQVKVPNIGRYVQELYRLALFIGSLDSSLDFNPKLPYDPVKVGDTWKRTVGYSPQKVGNTDRAAVQKVDYIYTFKGLIENQGKKYYRINASINLDTDMAPFINQLFEKPEESGIKSIKLKMIGSIDFDLDMATNRTVRASADSEGAFSIEATDSPNEAMFEEKLKGHTDLALVNSK